MLKLFDSCYASLLRQNHQLRRIPERLASIMTTPSDRKEWADLLVHLSLKLLPTESRQLQSLMNLKAPFPVSGNTRYIASGDHFDVFMVGRADTNSVLKVFRGDQSNLHDIISSYRQEWEYCSSNYAEVALVLPETYFIGPHPVSRVPTICIIQDHVDDQWRDFYTEEYSHRMKPFISRTQQLFYRNGCCPDIVGTRNILISPQGEIIIVDPHELITKSQVRGFSNRDKVYFFSRLHWD